MRPKEKILWFFESEKPHKWEVYALERVSDKWVTSLECTECGRRRKVRGVTDDELLRKGFTANQLRTIIHVNRGYWHQSAHGSIEEFVSDKASV